MSGKHRIDNHLKSSQLPEDAQFDKDVSGTPPSPGIDKYEPAATPDLPPEIQALNPLFQGKAFPGASPDNVIFVYLKLFLKRSSGIKKILSGLTIEERRKLYSVVSQENSKQMAALVNAGLPAVREFLETAPMHPLGDKIPDVATMDAAKKEVLKHARTARAALQYARELKKECPDKDIREITATWLAAQEQPLWASFVRGEEMDELPPEAVEKWRRSFENVMPPPPAAKPSEKSYPRKAETHKDDHPARPALGAVNIRIAPQKRTLGSLIEDADRENWKYAVFLDEVRKLNPMYAEILEGIKNGQPPGLGAMIVKYGITSNSATQYLDRLTAICIKRGWIPEQAARPQRKTCRPKFKKPGYAVAQIGTRVSSREQFMEIIVSPELFQRFLRDIRYSDSEEPLALILSQSRKTRTFRVILSESAQGDLVFAPVSGKLVLKRARDNGRPYALPFLRAQGVKIKDPVEEWLAYKNLGVVKRSKLTLDNVADYLNRHNGDVMRLIAIQSYFNINRLKEPELRIFLDDDGFVFSISFVETQVPDFSRKLLKIKLEISFGNNYRIVPGKILGMGCADTTVASPIEPTDETDQEVDGETDGAVVSGAQVLIGGARLFAK